MNYNLKLMINKTFKIKKIKKYQNALVPHY